MPTESEISELSNFRGPSFQMVEEVPFEVFERDGGFTDRTTPILLKGAVRHWPAWENWTFDKLATQCDLNEKAIKAIFETALSEQGKTQEKGFLEVSPYLRSLDLAAQEGGNPDKGLLSLNRRATLDAKSRFHLDWARINFVPNKVYLAQWNMLTHLPQLRNDFPMQRIWPGLRKTWEYAFIGPADTLTGLHYDFPNNWFCQVRGVKEVLLFTPDQTPHIAIGKKYDWGAKLSDVDISRLYKKNDIRDRFE